jgi:4-amino-4-deoxy-L-arabinose transferase-like glycosyltransferase
VTRGRAAISGARPPELSVFLRRPVVLLWVGALLGAASLAVYNHGGYSRGMLLVWLAAVVTLGLYCWKESAALPWISLGDFAAAVGLALVFVPLYVVHLYDWPVQVSSDEPTIMDVSDDYTHQPGFDPFGYSTYQTRPALLFAFWGHAGKLIGGIDLYHMRLLHAVVGLAAIGLSYFLFRQLLPRPWALFAGCLFGLNHAYFMLSRLAMRENTGVFIEVVALALLLYGLRRSHLFVTYLGGIAAGLGFYTYHPGRAAFPLWVLFLLMLGLLYRSQIPLRRLARFGAIAVAGFVIMAGPLLIAESKAPQISVEVDPMAQLLITSRGREFQRTDSHSDSVLEGYKNNVEWGLTTFNSKVHDHGNIYINEGHGFVDPLTGILLWVGVVGVGLWYVRRRRTTEPWPLLMLSSFLTLWIAFAFLINQAPKYPRLLIILPFVAYLVTEAVRLLGRLLERGLSRLGYRHGRLPRVALVGAVLAVIAAWNLAIAWDYVDRGRREGEQIGSTGRYLASHPTQRFYLVDDEASPNRYFSRGNPDWWDSWTSRFSLGVGLQASIRPDELSSLHPPPPFTLLLSREFLGVAESDLRSRYPDGWVRNVTPDGRLVVFEVPAAQN